MEKTKTHKLTINIPEEILKPLKRIALDNDTTLTQIITAHLQFVMSSGRVPLPALPELAL